MDKPYLAGELTLSEDWRTAGADDFVLESHPSVTNPAITPDLITDQDNVYMVADPFVVKNGDTYYLFVEAQYDDGETLNIGVGNVTGVFTSPDGITWTYLGKCTGLDAGNYNQVLRLDDTNDNLHGWYQMPHANTNTGWLYWGYDFPLKWSKVKRLITETMRDGTIFQWNGYWYILFSGLGSTPLYLYVSSNLLSVDFTAHPASPIQTGTDKCRPGGRPIIRPGVGVDVFLQKNDVTYGGGLRAFRLTDLTPTTCTITELANSPVLSASGIDAAWNKDGMHQLDRINANVSLVDGKILVDGQDVWTIGIYRDTPDE